MELDDDRWMKILNENSAICKNVDFSNIIETNLPLQSQQKRPRACRQKRKKFAVDMITILTDGEMNAQLHNTKDTLCEKALLLACPVKNSKLL